eukprot:GHVR01165557.1.p1 GENE.GHVR01165557.1~~GHVR01165557.1.p1  ORF type:complete len:109 (-),score=14.26 GHVR01165557.1:286-612(-)
MIYKEKEVEVLIIGAGPTGLTLAVDLARRGIEFLLIDRSERCVLRTRAILIHIRTLELLNELGISCEMIRQGNYFKGIHTVIDGYKEHFIEGPIPPYEGPIPYPIIYF